MLTNIKQSLYLALRKAAPPLEVTQRYSRGDGKKRFIGVAPSSTALDRWTK